MSDQERPFLLVEDIVTLWSEVAGAPIAPATVWAYLKQSRPGGRHEEHPLRGPTGRISGHPKGAPYWVPREGETLAHLRAEMRDWYVTGPGKRHVQAGGADR